MTVAGDADKYRKERDARSVSKVFGRFKVATTTPFEVYLNGTATAVPALKVDGLTYSVGTTGLYVHIQGQQPVCLPTTS